MSSSTRPGAFIEPHLPSDFAKAIDHTGSAQKNMSKRFNAKTIFMLAPQRHGSNKTQALLATHNPSMFGPFPPVLRQPFIPLEAPLGEGLLDAMVANANLSPRPLSSTSDEPIDPAEVRDVMVSELLPETTLGIMTALYRVGARREGRGDARILCKSPDNLMLFDEITEHVRDAIFIHVVRDPRGVWNSGRGTARGPKSPHAAATDWNDYHSKALALAERFPIHSLRFEDLLNQPDLELQNACRFLEVPFDPAMLNAHDSPAARNAAQASDALWGNLSKPIKSSRASAWQNELPAYEIEILETVCSDLMTRLGYELTQPTRSLKQSDIEYVPPIEVAAEEADPRRLQLAHSRGLYEAFDLKGC